MIDLKELYSILEKEKRNNQKIYKLPDNYYKKIKDEIEKVEKQLNNLDRDTEEYNQLYTYLKNLESTFYELIMIRYKKIINISELEVKNNIEILDNSLLQDFEIYLYDISKTIFQYLKEYSIGKISEYKELFDRISSIIRYEKKEKNKAILVILNDYNGTFIGPNNKLYGPFKKNDILICDKNFGEKLEKASLAKKIL